MSGKNIHKIILLLILVVAAFFRFYNFENRITLGLDSSRDVFVAFEGARTLQLPITGPFISIAPVTTGPWYWIQLILAKLVLRTSFAPWLLLGIFSLATVYIMYRIGTLLAGKTFGLFLAYVAAVSSDQISKTVELSNPSVIGFYASILVLLFIRLFAQKISSRLCFIFGLILGITINIHYQSTALLTLPFTLLFLRKIPFKMLLAISSGIFLTFVPTLLFEFLNHWYNSRGMLNYLLVDQYKIWVPMRWLWYIDDFWPRFISFVLGGDKLFGMVMMILITFTMLFYLLKKKLSKIMLLLILNFLVFVVIIRYYRGERYFGYLQFFHPFIFIFTGYVLYQSFKTRLRFLLGIPVILLYSAAVLPSTFSRLASDPLTVETRVLVAQIKEKFGPGPFKLYSCKGVVKNEIVSLVAMLDMKGLYNSKIGKPLAYYWGCFYPDVVINGKAYAYHELPEPDKTYPQFGFMIDFSAASEAAILKWKWEENSPKKGYQSAARWWMDEQP